LALYDGALPASFTQRVHLYEERGALSDWYIAKTFATEQKCLDHRKLMSDKFAHMIGAMGAKGVNPDPFLHCVAIDDPRLKKK